MPATIRKHPLVYIVVLNWNGWIDTLHCLEHLDELDYPNYQVIVVDNGSTDGSEQRITDMRPDVRFIQTGSNLGFGGGNNVGIQAALDSGAEYVWVLNNDTEVPADSLGKLVEAMESDRRIGLLGAEAYDPHAQAPIGLAPIPGVTGAPLTPFEDDDRPLPSNVRPSEYVHGSCLLARRETLEDLRGFDVRYFHFWEDIDLCWRARSSGWLVGYLDSCRILHRAGTSTIGASALRMYYTLRNLLIFGARASDLPVSRYMLTVPGLRIWVPCVLGIRGFLRPRFKVAILRALVHAARSTVGRCSTYSPS